MNQIPVTDDMMQALADSGEILYEQSARGDVYRGMINDGIRFLQSLNEVYGVDRAMAVWSALGPAMGDEVKGQVFMSMLSGNTATMRLQLSRSSSVIPNPSPGSVAVPVIKVIRAVTGLGLKEAKDKWDETAYGMVWLDCQSRNHAEQARTELQILGMIVR
jgi:ribosomal protein L7/L12